ncbi:MAG TPA: hypothetical protein DDX89_05320 [Candidatus Omnitrophica bacterium]|nr:MAG: hypothetical protein A2Z92_05695 [Omnitrophica WOR_2 bacterium GWA2_63_20]OGX31130.1 MAG: hypothetical protein A3E56_00040 [Omnitrophica WOR_2 bacterium RIFCSPHIGHO2_12_FULL_64_13]OGX35726.1 MAG: hypothetical protein A3B73_03315 [Omnitrophica WOR_2 bacterium RIFCSPHIGHO2_02_FULL_63_39]OGX45781.1 MAG: hypothetical protein A3I71_01265 [Omnitrophica WOR_2 bacterium RIFCSPLOWO2_02_FULL_63_16]OGX49377.1 MAG: hypothetical protein A3G88_06135 [Omnitrophica WOR_2 bacterium RIFCSPLOWO2_12_FULL_6
MMTATGLRPASGAWDHPTILSSRDCAIGFFLYGAIALIAQLLCLQELLLLVAGHELFLGCSLAAWMTWVGLGSWLARRAPVDRFATVLSLAMPLVILNVILIRVSKGLFGVGMTAGLLPSLLLTITLLIPAGLVMGALFGLGYAWCRARSAWSLGQAYLWDALGTAVGGLFYSLVLAGRAAPERILVLVALAITAIACAVKTRRTIAVSILSLGVSLAFALSPLPRLTRTLQWRGYSLLAERTTRYSHLALAKTGSLVSVFDNGLISAHFPDPSAYEALAHWPLLAHPAPRRILLIGGGATGTLAELLKHPVEQIDYVELDPAFIRMIRPALSSSDRAALDDPRVRLRHVDGRRWLSTTTQAYDVILLSLPEPRNAQVNRLYTLEAFRLIRRRLAPGGVFAFTVPSSENYLSAETAYFNASLYQTLRAAFPSVNLIGNDPLLLLAGTQDVWLDWQTLAARYAQRGLTTREVVPHAFPILLDQARRIEVVDRLSSIRAIVLNRDFVPVCYAYAWRVWISKFVSPMYFLSLLVAIALLAFGARLLWRRRALLASRPGASAVFALGAAGMAYETIILLAFQSLHGYLYWQLGSLFAAFMLGLALGSWGASQRLSTASPDAAARRLRGVLMAAALEGVALALFLPVAQHLSLRVSAVLLFGAWLLLTGAWLGYAFPLAGRLAPASDPASIAGTLYAADLWGAACGALVTSAVLVPLIGFLPTLAIASGLLLLVASALSFTPHSALRIPHSG